MGSNGHLNGSIPTIKSFPPGIHAPSLTFFQNDEQQEIDWATQERHLEFLVTSGVHGSTFPRSRDTLLLAGRAELTYII